VLHSPGGCRQLNETFAVKERLHRSWSSFTEQEGNAPPNPEAGRSNRLRVEQLELKLKEAWKQRDCA
jgi:hypothetical protein